jgi:hypothetical protein
LGRFPVAPPTGPPWNDGNYAQVAATMHLRHGRLRRRARANRRGHPMAAAHVRARAWWGDLATPRDRPIATHLMSATVICDGPRHSATANPITEVFHFRQSRGPAAALSAHARGRPLRRPLHSHPREAPDLRNRATLFEAWRSRRLSRRRPSGMGGSRRQGVDLRPRRRHRTASKAP